MSTAATSALPGLLEHPAEALGYYAAEGVAEDALVESVLEETVEAFRLAGCRRVADARGVVKAP